MADAKISQLPVATTPLAGTELVPVVQGGVTVQTTTDAILTGTVPSGTANGVLYLNGSKVVTSGSALTFDGTNLGIGTSSPGEKLDVVSAGNGGIQYRTGTRTVGIGQSAGEAAVYWGSGTALTFFSGSEQMRLTSTGLGIGTNNPTEKLTVSGGAAFSRIGFNANPIDVVSTSQSFVRFNSTGADFYVGTESSSAGAFFPGSSAYAAVLYNANATPMHFYTAAAVRATIDASGNLGLGVTPSAWNADYKAIQVGANGSIAGRVGTSNSFDFTSNAYRDNVGGDWRYIASSGVSRYLIDGSTSAHYWFTAPSGTAGNAISFSQVMTLDANGNLGVGSTAPVAYSGYVGITAQATNGGFVNLRNGTLSHQMEIAIESGGGTGYVKTVTASPLIFGTNNTEKLRLKPEGQLRFVPLAADPSGAEAGDVYYNSGTNKLRLYDGSTWVDLN